jgi:hypothetical protein
MTSLFNCFVLFELTAIHSAYLALQKLALEADRYQWPLSLGELFYLYETSYTFFSGAAGSSRLPE